MSSSITTSHSKVLELWSFGQRYGPLTVSSTLAYDVRTIPNPPRDFRQQQKASNDNTALRQWLLTNPIFKSRIEDARREILELVVQVDKGLFLDDYPIVVGINCELGRHRSVTFVDELARRLKEKLGADTTWEIRVRHRDLERRSSKRCAATR